MGTHYGFYGKTLAFISEDQDISVDLARAEGMWEANMLVEWWSRTRRGIMNDRKGRGRRKGGGGCGSSGLRDYDQLHVSKTNRLRIQTYWFFKNIPRCPVVFTTATGWHCVRFLLLPQNKRG